MTLPDERYRALRQTRLFLQELCDPSKTPKVSTVVRSQARGLLRHYASDYDLDRMAEAAPQLLTQRMEDLHRFVTMPQRDLDNKI